MGYYLKSHAGFQTLHFPALQVAGAGHGFTTRQGPGQSRREAFAFLNMGLRTGEDPELVKKNHRLFLTEVGLAGYPLVTGEQVHGSLVAPVTGCRDFCVIPGADSLVTDREGLILSLFAADCALVFLVDRAGRAVGIAHAGWRGAVAGIGRKAVEELSNRFGAAPRDLLVGLSPCIGTCCFQVRQDVARALEEEGLPAGEFLLPGPGGDSWFMDLKALIAWQLRRAGVPAGQIYGTALCTSCRRDLFYSYRRDRGITGRMMGYVYLEKRGA
jgi:polyphenol oxidase